MQSLDLFLSDIVYRARFLSEVPRSPSTTRASVTGLDAAANDLLGRWIHAAARGDVAALERRWSWGGFDKSDIGVILAEGPLGVVAELPTWAKTVALIMQSAGMPRTLVLRSGYEGSKSARHAASASCLDPERPIAFEEVLLPAVWVAREQLLTRLGVQTLDFSLPPLRALSEQSYVRLERSLLERLSYLAAQALGKEFAELRPAGLTLAGILGIESDEHPRREYYDSFVKKLLEDRYADLFRRYPVLARVIAVAIEGWVGSCSDFIERLETDLPVLLKFFGPGGNGHIISARATHRGVRVESLETDLSDPHDGGRTVIALTLSTGLRLVYKPRTLRLEATYNEFLRWCNENGAPLDFGLARVLSMGAYGWMEYIDHTPCGDSRGVKRFYARAGALLCVLYVLGATDCHYENLVAHGEYPVLVDAETLLHPQALPSSGEVDVEAFDSVLRTGMLPHWECWQKTNVLRDASAVGAVNPEGVPFPAWHQVNTDEMYLKWFSRPVSVKKHIPFYEGEATQPEDHVHAFVDGFRRMAHFFSTERAPIAAAGGPLSLFESVPVRFIFRPTNIYYRVLRSALSPEHLRSGIDWSIELEHLAYAYLADEELPIGWQIFEAEVQALERLDIPYFAADSGSTLFRAHPAAPPERFFRETSYKQAAARAAHLEEGEVERQAEIILGAFQAKRTVLHFGGGGEHSGAEPRHMSEASGVCASPDEVSMRSQEFLAKAEWIGHELERRAVPSGREGLNWLGWSYLPDGRHLQLDLLGHSLYDGRCGVALFFAALYAVTGSPRFKDVVERTLSILKELLDSPVSTRTRRWVKNMGIGGVGGLGSVVYVLVKIAHLIDDSVILDQAVRAAALLREEDIDSDEHYDLINGSAGTLLALLALHETTGERQALHLAGRCGRHLINRRVSVGAGVSGWQAGSSVRPLTGFSHGAAGIAYALLKLYKATGEQACYDVAGEAIAYERSTFSAERMNWPDFRTFGEELKTPLFSCSWCHGAPGIALARLGGLGVLDDPIIREETDIALRTTSDALARLRSPVDHLCCGNFGLVEVLLAAATILERPSLDQEALRQASALCERERIDGHFRLLGQPSAGQTFFSPIFFQGMAGIGYELLRLSSPKTFPSVLLIE